jgi:ribosomal protein S27E
LSTVSGVEGKEEHLRSFVLDLRLERTATMSTSMPVVETRLKEPFLSVACVHCQAQLEYLRLPPSIHPSDEPFGVRCVSCRQTFIIRPPKSKATGKRRIGSGKKRDARAREDGSWW